MILWNASTNVTPKNQEILTMPEVKIAEQGSRIMSLQEPTKKMSKSDTNVKGFISMLDEPAVIRKNPLCRN